LLQSVIVGITHRAREAATH